jgi:hypothetical protein
MSGSIPPLPNTPPWRGAHLKNKHRDYVISTDIGVTLVALLTVVCSESFLRR